MRGEDEKKTWKESDGLIWTAHSHARCLMRASETHSAPPSPVWSTCNRLKHSASSLLLQLLQLQERIIVRLLKSGFSAVLVRPASMWRGFTRRPLWTQWEPVCVCVWQQTILTYASLFGLWLPLPQNKYVLKAWVFVDITVYHIQSPQAIFEPGPVKNSLGPLSPRRRTNSVKRNDAFLNHDITASVLVPKTFTKIRENVLDFLVKDKVVIEGAWMHSAINVIFVMLFLCVLYVLFVFHINLHKHGSVLRLNASGKNQFHRIVTLCSSVRLWIAWCVLL